MGNLSPVSKIFVLAGLILIAIGVFINFGLGRLPGDIYIKKENFTFYHYPQLKPHTSGA